MKISHKTILASLLTPLIFLTALPAIAATITQNPSSASLKNGLIGWWTMDNLDISGTEVRDKSGGGNHGVNSNATQTSGKIGQALYFDGAITVVNATVALPSTISISTWATWGIEDYGMLFLAGPNNSGPDAFFYQGQICLNTWDGCGNPFGAIPANANDGQFHHYVFVIQSGNTKLYYDGALLGSANYANPSGSTLGIGGISPYLWKGKIDEFRLYNRALSASEARQLYQIKPATVGKTPNTASYRQNIGINSGLVGWWTMDGVDANATQVLDKSGQNNTQLRTDVTPVPGKIGQAMSFNGTTSHMYSSGTFVAGGAPEFTVTAWAKKNTAAGGTIAFQNGPFFFDMGTVLGNTSYAVLTAENSWKGAAGTTALQAGQWYHLAMTYSSSTQLISLYVNGKLDGTGPQHGGLWPGISCVGIGMANNGGCTGGGSQTYFNGSIDEVRVYNRALSSSEIKQLYAQGIATVGKTPGAESYKQGQSINSGLVGWWNFDGNNGTLDMSGRGNNGTISGGVTKAMGKMGQAMRLDGTGAIYFGLGASLNLPSRVTLSGWVCPTVIGVSYPILFGKGYDQSGSYSVHMRTDGSLWFEIDDIDATRYYYNPAGAFLSVNKWAHVVATYDGITQRIYVNGVQDGTGQTASSDFGTTAAQFSIGPTLSGPGNFTGSIDDVRVYNRALSLTEIQQLYQMGK